MFIEQDAVGHALRPVRRAMCIEGGVEHKGPPSVDAVGKTSAYLSALCVSALIPQYMGSPQSRGGHRDSQRRFFRQTPVRSAMFIEQDHVSPTLGQEGRYNDGSGMPIIQRMGIRPRGSRSRGHP